MKVSRVETGVRQSEDCQKFGRTAKFGNIFTIFLFTMSIFDNGNDPYWSSRKRSSRTYRITNQLLEINFVIPLAALSLITDIDSILK